MLENHILSLQIFLPLLGAIALALMPRLPDNGARWVAVVISTAVFALSLCMLGQFDGGNPGFQLVEKYVWFPDIGLSYHLGIDGISVYFILLSTFLTPICILSCWHAVTKRVREYMIAFLVLESFMVGTFCALDSILFYVFFEGVLIPMFLIIGIWGGARRVYASFKFFLYTLLGSVLMLVALLTLYYQTGTTDIPALMNSPVASGLQIWLWLAFFASFAVKMPMWPVHTWLPDAHVEAPTAGSVILAGVLLKMGGYGFLRFSLPIMPEASEFFAPMVMWLSVVAIVYTALVALVQEDMKKLIAYSSVSHMGFVTLGIFSATTQGVEGAIFQMLSHGIISAALFLCVGVVYDRLHTREITRYGGLVKNMPKYATVFMVFMLGSVGLPGTSGFVGEFLTLLGSFQASTYIAVFATTGIIFGAAYMLVLYRRVIFGEQKNADAAAMPDLNRLELGILAPLALMVILFGVAPGLVMKDISPSVERLLRHYNTANETAGRILAAQDGPQDGAPAQEDTATGLSLWRPGPAPDSASASDAASMPGSVTPLSGREQDIRYDIQQDTIILHDSPAAPQGAVPRTPEEGAPQ